MRWRDGACDSCSLLIGHTDLFFLHQIRAKKTLEIRTAHMECFESVNLLVLHVWPLLCEVAYLSSTREIKAISRADFFHSREPFALISPAELLCTLLWFLISCLQLERNMRVKVRSMRSMLWGLFCNRGWHILMRSLSSIRQAPSLSVTQTYRRGTCVNTLLHTENTQFRTTLEQDDGMCTANLIYNTIHVSFGPRGPSLEKSLGECFTLHDPKTEISSLLSLTSSSLCVLCVLCVVDLFFSVLRCRHGHELC